MKQYLSLCALIAVATVFLHAPAWATVTDEVKLTVDKVVAIVSDPALKKPQNEEHRRAELKKAISRIFDYGEMAKRSLGVHWKKRNAAEQKEFVNLFATLLENSYAGKIESYENERIVYGKETIEGDYAEVKSKIVTAKRDEYTIDYRLLKEGSRWMVYDVVIEGVSLVSNYRSQFNKIILNQGYGALVKKLKAKSEEISSL
ncbi:MAG TPA: ABC transporter substrate-binding protein [Geobacteraceae bacterium]|nr:ABC transporter substrate-binding protein [Geobacteraceae bacterium]